jgi:inorganic pyrophosphatase
MPFTFPSESPFTFAGIRNIGVAVQSYNHENIRSINEVKKSLLDQVAECFVSYDKSRGKKFKVTAVRSISSHQAPSASD